MERTFKSTIGSFLLGLFIFTGVAVISWQGAQRIPANIILQLDNAGVVLGYALACFAVAVAPLAWFRRTDIRRWFRGTNFENTGLPFDVPRDRFECAVIPVSNRAQPEWILSFLEPRKVSFLYTDLSREVAVKLADDYSKPPYDIRFHPDASAIKKSFKQLDSVDEPEESKRLVSDFLQRFIDEGSTKDQIFVDTTGGKVPMSIGGFQAAEELGISSFYVVGTDKGAKINPKSEKSGNPVFISDRT